jgi:hypothetical protein
MTASTPSKASKAISHTATVEDHFTGKPTAVEATYRRLLRAARELGPVREDPKKTSIHLVRETAFAGVATRKTSLVLTVKSAFDIASPRIVRRERTSPNRWHLEIRLDRPNDVDRELVGWLAAAYDLSD